MLNCEEPDNEDDLRPDRVGVVKTKTSLVLRVINDFTV